MPGNATFLHITDAHLAGAGVTLPRDDHKVDLPDVPQETREGALDLTLARLAEALRKEDRLLDGLIFSGDAQEKGAPGGHRILFDLIMKHFADRGVKRSNIVAIPGNHDVPRGSMPGSRERYDAFLNVWRKEGCITPWLDGIDAGETGTGVLHRLVDERRQWAIYPVNTSNWSHTPVILPEPLASIWANLPTLASGGDPEKAAALQGQLDDLARYDMARVSGHQLEFVRKIIDETPQPVSGRQLKIAVLHHHLRAPSLREELKPFPDMSNLEQVRSFLRDRGIAIVVHGHKHEHAAQFEHIYDQDGGGDHRTLVISGATLDPGRETDAVRLISVTGMPNNPTVTIEPIAVPRHGVDLPNPPKITRRLWRSSATAGAPIIIQGSDLDEVYERACEAAATEAAGGTLIVHLDLPQAENRDLPLPTDYPLPNEMDEAARSRWLNDLVDWWQRERSGLEHRMPFIHGSRLRRFGGKIDQIDRVIKLLKRKASTRAIAVLIDPFRDFTSDGQNEEFASFCLVEFKRRDLGKGAALDAISFYRAQEFARWWPINVAEIRHLQWEICTALGFTPGRITTIAADARTHSRSPTQVAMPILDRWLDQAPEKVHLLANALAEKNAQIGVQAEAVQGWKTALTDLEAAATEFNPDGLPVAIEGLTRLAAYLEAVDSDDAELRQFARILQRLARANEGYEDGDRTKTEFDRWAPTVLEAVGDLRQLTSKRLENHF